MKIIDGTVRHLIGTEKNPNVFIYKNENSPNRWWISYRIPGLSRRYESLKTASENDAIMAADNFYHEKLSRYKKLGKHALTTKGTMQDCLNNFIHNKDETDVVASPERAAQVISHWERFYIPYFGKDTIVTPHTPTKQQIRDYRKWRRTKYKPADGSRPRANKLTLQVEAVSLNQVWGQAVEDHIIEGHPKVIYQKITSKVRERSASVPFDDNEIPKIVSNFDDWCGQKIGKTVSNGKIKTARGGFNSFHRIGRERLRCFILLLLMTSARPSSMRALKWKDIETLEHDGQLLTQFAFRHSKKDKMYSCIAFGYELDAQEIINRWKTFSPTWAEKNHDSLRVFDISKKRGKWQPFADSSHSFRNFLSKYKMLTHPTDRDKKRKSRGTYSCRTSAISHRLAVLQLPVEMVASEANTSIDQISKVYWKPTSVHKMSMYTSIPKRPSASVTSIKRKEGKAKRK